MDTAKILLLAGGALAAAAVAAAAAHPERAAVQPSPTRTKRVARRRTGTRQLQEQQQQQHAGIVQHAVATQVPAMQPPSHAVYHSPPPAPAPMPEQPTPFLLLLVPLLSLAAVLYADRLRPEEYTDAQEWRQLVAAAAVATCTLHLAAAALSAWARAASPGAAAARPAVTATARPVAVTAAATSMPARPAAPAPAVAVPAAAPLQDLSGTWVKDRAASDSMEAACDAMHLGGIIRSAIRLIRGLEVRCDDQLFRMSVLSGILWFKVTESYPVSGQPAQWRRRDLRKGKHVGRVQRCPVSGGLLLRLEWGEPYGGHAVDLFKLVEPDVLHVSTDMTVGSTRVLYTQVYRRKGR